MAWNRIVVKDNTKKRLEACKEEFLMNNPKFRNFHITQDFLMNKIIDYYLEE